MSTLTPTTEIEAVNEMLTAIGSQPVNTLDAPGSSDIAIAKDTLRATSRETQSRGWWFNSGYNRTFVPSNNEIVVPSNILSIRPTRGTATESPETQSFVLVDAKLYDPLSNSHTFNSSVRADVITHLEFEHLPESVRRYVAVRAARLFQTKTLGDGQLGVFTEDHENEAWQVLEGDDAVSNPYSNKFLQRSRQMARIMRPDPETSMSDGEGGRRRYRR